MMQPAQAAIPLTQPQTKLPTTKSPTGVSTQPVGAPKPAAAPIDLSGAPQAPTAPKPAAQPHAQSTGAAPQTGTADPLAFANPATPTVAPSVAPVTAPATPHDTTPATAPGSSPQQTMPDPLQQSAINGMLPPGTPHSAYLDAQIGGQIPSYITNPADRATYQALADKINAGQQLSMDELRQWDFLRDRGSVDGSADAVGSALSGEYAWDPWTMTGDLPPNAAQQAALITGSTPNHGGASGGASGTGSNGVGLTPTNPADSLLGQTITPDNTVDRVQLAQDALHNTITNVLDPQYQADLRSANRLSFGSGRGVSGLNRTSLGNVQSDYERTKSNLTNNLLNAATTGSIDDLYRNIGIAQQQQGFQRDLLNDAFNQNFQTQQLSDAERQQLFNEALQQFYAGNISDPAQFYEFIAGQYARPVGGTT